MFLKQSGLKVSNLYIAQVKQKHGIIERENYNKPKSEDAKQPQCPPDKERAITEALKHLGMIFLLFHRIMGYNLDIHLQEHASYYHSF